MIEHKPFGATGHASSRVIFGAAAVAGGSDAHHERVLQTLLDFGINHIDTAASYGAAEDNLKKWFPEHRERFFLATKTGDRAGDAARASLERSLERMGVDQVDLVQLHNLVEEDEWQQAFAPDGAVKALFQARDEGLCRFVGVTGHGLRIPRMHLRSLAEAPFASVLVPYSHVLLQDDGYRADIEELLTVCVEREVAVQTIKAVARRRWEPDHQGARFSWYEPLEPSPAMERAVHHVLANDQLFLNTSSDARKLRPVLEAAAAYEARPTDDDLAMDRESMGITPLFDGADLDRI